MPHEIIITVIANWHLFLWSKYATVIPVPYLDTLDISHNSIKTIPPFNLVSDLFIPVKILRNKVTPQRRKKTTPDTSFNWTNNSSISHNKNTVPMTVGCKIKRIIRKGMMFWFTLKREVWQSIIITACQWWYWDSKFWIFIYQSLFLRTNND